MSLIICAMHHHDSYSREHTRTSRSHKSLAQITLVPHHISQLHIMLTRRAIVATRRWARLQSSSAESSTSASAKLFADAIEEESRAIDRDHLRHTQGRIWDGDEAVPDAVLRMLVDANKPMRTGQIKSADEKIKGWMKGVKLEHRTTIPPEQHRPWHATYTGDTQTIEEPKVKYGTFIRKRAEGDALQNILELPGLDGKMKKKVKDARRVGKLVKRIGDAKEGALDYRLKSEEEKFEGNRQVRGASVLGAAKGGASGLRAWAGLVEDRIQRAKGECNEASLIRRGNV